MAIADLFTPTRPAQQSVEASIREAATRGELYVCVGRSTVLLIVLVRQGFVFLNEDFIPTTSLGISVAVWLGVVLGLSLYIVLRYRGGAAPMWLLATSVAIDAAVCFLALLGNTLWPGPRYSGNLLLPDIAFLVIPIVAAPIRLYPSLVVEATLLTAAGFIGLVAIDVRFYPLPFIEFFGRTTTVGVLLAATAIGSYLTAVAIRRLALDAAERTLQAEGMQHRLGVLMRDHHDARTLLSSAALNAELVHQSLTRDGARRDDELREIAGDLRKDLQLVNAFVAAIRERAYSGVERPSEQSSVDVAAAIREVVGVIEPLFPETRISLRLSCDGHRAVVTGGATNLRHAVQNLLANACEGDGHRRSQSVEIAAATTSDGARLAIEIQDDGPGFPAEVLASPVGRRTTTKPEGSGLGLWLVETWLQDHGARLERSNGTNGGARVRFELPATPSPEA